MHYLRAGRTLRYLLQCLLARLIGGYVDIDLIQRKVAGQASGLLLRFDLVFQCAHCPSLLDLDLKCGFVANNGAIKKERH